MNEITVQELKEKMDNGDSFFLLDVREPFEYNISNINGELLPIDQLPDRIEELEDKKNIEIVVMCRSGNRSAKACELLSGHGFSDVKNLKGGINAWAKEIDNSLPVY